MIIFEDPTKEGFMKLTRSQFCSQMECLNMHRMPDTSFVLYDVSEEEKKSLVLSHSEKLAIAFWIINTNPGMPIEITKNL